jgi:hypothetical protein
MSSALVDLGSLIQGTIVKRPSSVIKTPYVADVKVSSTDSIVQVMRVRILFSGLRGCDAGDVCTDPRDIARLFLTATDIPSEISCSIQSM